jgi:hypothetical protein
LSPTSVLTMMLSMPRTITPNSFSRAVQRLLRRVPRSEPAAEHDDWVDPDPSWHNSSFDLARGLVVTELFDDRRSTPNFSDTLPAYHEHQSVILAQAQR